MHFFFFFSLNRADSIASLYSFDEVRLFFFFSLFAWGGWLGGAGGLLDNLTTHRSEFIPLYCVAKDEPLEFSTNYHLYQKYIILHENKEKHKLKCLLSVDGEIGD